MRYHKSKQFFFCNFLKLCLFLISTYFFRQLFDQLHKFVINITQNNCVHVICKNVSIRQWVLFCWEFSFAVNAADALQQQYFMSQLKLLRVSIGMGFNQYCFKKFSLESEDQIHKSQLLLKQYQAKFRIQLSLVFPSGQLILLARYFVELWVWKCQLKLNHNYQNNYNCIWNQCCYHRRCHL